MDFTTAKTTLVVGRRKFGKSTFIRNKLLPELRQPVVVLDPKGEYGPAHGFKELFYSLDDFIDAGQFWRASCRRFDYEDAASLFETLYHYQSHTLVVEEAHLYCSPSFIEPGLSTLIRMGAEPGISLVLVSQRVRDFPQIAYSMADRLVVFQQRSVHDLAALEAIIDEDLSDLSKLERDQFREFEL